MAKTKARRKPVAKQQQPPKEQVTLQEAYLLQNESLLPLSTGYTYPVDLIERKYRSVSELEELVIKNHKALFGQRTFIIRISTGVFGTNAIPNLFILDIGNPAKPRVSILEFAQGEFYSTTFPRITRLTAHLLNKESIQELLDAVSKDKLLKTELLPYKGELEYDTFIKSVFTGKIGVLLFTNEAIIDLQEVKQVYSGLWQMVKEITIKKYVNKHSTFCTVLPHYRNTQVNGKKVKHGEQTYTERDHTEKSLPEVVSAYERIKEEVLKTSKEGVSFNAQKYYISLKNGSNVAFFHFAKKNISVVVKHEEKATRKLIKHHEVKSLKDSVQKFWGGPSCTVVIENSTHLNEVVVLLKGLLAKRV